MNPRPIFDSASTALIALTLLAAPLCAHGGWIPPVNPGLAGAATARPTGGFHRGPPAARVGLGEVSGAVPVSAIRPRPGERPHHAAPGVTPYLVYWGPVPGVSPAPEPDTAPHRDPDGGIFIGMTKRALLDLLGRPNAAVYEASGRETLLFGNVRVVVQNGIVAFVQ